MKEGFYVNEAFDEEYILLTRLNKEVSSLQMANKKVKVKVKFTQQQMELLDKLKQEGKFGESHGEICAAVFKEYVTQTFGVGGL